MPPKRRSTRDARFDNGLDALLGALGEALKPAAEEFGKRVVNEWQRQQSRYDQPGLGPPEGRDRVLPPPDTHLLVWQRILVDGQPKDRWILVDKTDPKQSIDELMRGWESDYTVRAQMVFEGKLLMRGNKDRNEPTPS